MLHGLKKIICSNNSQLPPTTKTGSTNNCGHIVIVYGVFLINITSFFKSLSMFILLFFYHSQMNLGKTLQWRRQLSERPVSGPCVDQSQDREGTGCCRHQTDGPNGSWSLWRQEGGAGRGLWVRIGAAEADWFYCIFTIQHDSKLNRTSSLVCNSDLSNL